MRCNGKLTPELRAIVSFFFEGFVNAKDSAVYTHSKRVSAWAVQIARKLSLGDEECEMLRLAGFLHDAGKLILAEGVLLRAARLTPQETRVVQTHPEEGYKLLRKFTQSKIILSSILEHHERIDGSGYPHHKTSPSVYGQIMGVADYFTARQEPRVYRHSLFLSRGQSYRATMAQPFEPEVLKAFEQVYLAECRTPVRNIKTSRRR